MKMVFGKDAASICNYGISAIILVSFIIIWIVSTQNNSAIKALILKLDTALPHEKKTKKWANQEMVIESSAEKGQPEKIAEAEDEFGEMYARYNTLCQLVTIFPLLGIFGTVLGIILMGDVSAASMSSFALALWTTLWGLVASIALKTKRSLGAGKSISKGSCFF